MANKNLKKNTGETEKKNKSTKDWMAPEKVKVKKALEKTAGKLKTAPDINTPAKRKAAKTWQAAEKKATSEYLEDREKSIKSYKSGTQSGKEYAKQHPTRMELKGRELEKLKKNLLDRSRAKGPLYNY